MSATSPLPTTTPIVVDASSFWKSYQAIYKIVTTIKTGNLPDDDKIEFVVKDHAEIIEDIKRWCGARGHEFYEIDMKMDSGKDGIVAAPGTRRCGLVKHTRMGENEWEARRRGREMSLTAIISTEELEEVLFPLEKALAAAVLGMDVNIVFEGAGVRFMKRGYQPNESIEILEELGAKFWICGLSMRSYKVGPEEVGAKEWTAAGPVTWVELLATTNVHVFS
jgi:intracellular sulfur oxidation DsrE/DsrF family protein